MSLTSELLDELRVNQLVSYLGQRSFSQKVIVPTRTQQNGLLYLDH